MYLSNLLCRVLHSQHLRFEYYLRNTVKEYQFADRIDRTYQRRPEPHPRDVRWFGNRQFGLPQRNGKDDPPAGRTEPGIQPFATGNDGQYGSGNRLPAACPPAATAQLPATAA